MVTRPVGIVAMEAVTSLGLSWNHTRSQLLEGTTGLERDTINDRETLVGKAPLSSSNRTRIPRYHQLASHALVNLLESEEELPPQPLGIVAASSKGGMGTLDVRDVVNLHNPGIWSATIASCFPQKTITSSPTTACATGLTSLIQGARWIRHGELDHVVVIVSESSFLPLLVGGYQNMNALCGRNGMRPFSPKRDGFALAEGAGVMYLQAQTLISDRDEPAIGYVEGWGETNDARHMTGMDRDGRGLRAAVQHALNDAETSLKSMDFVHCHLTTTEQNDDVERRILNEYGAQIWMQGIKPALGHSVGAAGLIEAISTLDVLHHDEAFPIVNCPENRLPASSDGSLENRRAITWNMGFGGHNAAVILSSERI